MTLSSIINEELQQFSYPRVTVEEWGEQAWATREEHVAYLVRTHYTDDAEWRRTWGSDR